ncbi:MAG: DUF5329 family protein [Thiotrichaceae bacterium]|nr:DUF5329 family protein [Thiotrichaceae bacterium]
MLKYFLVFILFVYVSVNADVPEEQVKEVDHLLTYIKNSGCIINRNGTDYHAEKGLSHIEKKYDYFRGDINSTEKFIEMSATKSTMSGNNYMAKCPGKETIKTQDWLLTELKQYRLK